MSSKKGLHRCSYENCTATFTRPYRLEIHLRQHTGERPFLCKYEGCDRSYISSSHLKRHAASHEGSFKCTMEGCCEILKTKDTLRKHIDCVHHKKNPKLYKCDECEKEFQKHNWLRSHMFKHTGTLPYKCQFEGCEKGFLHPSRLKRHMKVHEGHKCKIPGCNKVFNKWSVYVAHIKEFHPSVFTCSICNKKFSSISNLKAHAAVHSANRKVFTCEMPNCTRFYYAERNLTWHMKSYHETRPFVCDKELCHRAFKTQDALDEHKSRHTKRKQRKKKKQKPAFAAVLSGCADPRKFTYNKPRTQVASESSEEFSADDKETLEEEKTCDNSQSEIEGFESVNTNSASESSSFKCDGETHLKKVASDLDNNNNFGENEHEDDHILDKVKRLAEDAEVYITTLEFDENSNLKSPSKHSAFKSDEKDTSLIYNNPTVRPSDPMNSNSLSSIKKHKTCLDDSSSEYETITVSVLSKVDDINYSESDDVSSCVSEVEDMLNFCEGAFETRER